MQNNVLKVSQLCKELDLNPKDLPIKDNNVLVDQIYEKFFKDMIKAAHSCNTPTGGQVIDERTTTNQTPAIEPTTDDIWIFGYGSLVWKADFPYIDRRKGYICGYKRRFFQNSIDHRGTHAKPGRVVTLLHTDDDSSRVYGMAYRIAATHKDDVLQHLDYREKNGYERCALLFHEYPEPQHQAGPTFRITMYIATVDNSSYAGDVPEIDRIARQIFTSAGPSGPNREYLFKLAKAMRELFPDVTDQHLTDLENEVQLLCTRDEEKLLESAICGELHKILSKDEPLFSISETIDLIEDFRDSCQLPGWKEALLTIALQNSTS